MKLSCLAVVEFLGLMEVCQVFVVSENLDRKQGALEIMLPGPETMDDSKEFSVIDVVVSFHTREQLEEVGIGIPVPIGVCC